MPTGIRHIGNAPQQALGNEVDGWIPKVYNSNNFLLDVAAGLIDGYNAIGKFGRNPAVPTSGFAAIWSNGGTYTGFNATQAETVTVVSASANDSAAGTGLRTIRLYGLDADFIEQTEDVTLNGLTPVTSSLQYIRLDRARGLSAGSGGANAGNITVRQSITTAVIFAVVPAGYNSTTIAAYTIPGNKTGYIYAQRAAISDKQASSVAVRLRVRQPGNIFTVEGEAELNSQGTGFVAQSFAIPKKIPAKTDIFIEAGNASATVAVSAFLDILLKENN